MDTIQKLSAHFAQFPGIGARQSKRFVYFLLKKDRAYLHELVSLIKSLEDSVLECTRCHRYFMKKHKEAISFSGEHSPFSNKIQNQRSESENFAHLSKKKNLLSKRSSLHVQSPPRASTPPNMFTRQ